MKKTVITAALIAAMGIAGCQTLEGRGTKETVGGVGGAVLGGLAGSQVGSGSGRLWATGAGVLLGALLGSEIGSSLDKADKMYLARANEQAYSAPIGQSISWNNPESGNHGTVTPVRDGRDQAGSYCREYQQTIYVGGQQESGYGTACRRPDGSWEIVN